jgi:hypothetical protein
MVNNSNTSKGPSMNMNSMRNGSHNMRLSTAISSIDVASSDGDIEGYLILYILHSYIVLMVYNSMFVYIYVCLYLYGMM